METPLGAFLKEILLRSLLYAEMSLDSCFLNKAADIIKDLETNGWTSSWKISW